MINTISICLTIIISIFYIVRKCEKMFKLKHYMDIINLWNYFLSESYKITYDNDLILYMTDNVRIPNDQRETIERNFVKQTIMYMGSNTKRFIDFYGSEQTMIIHIIQYIRKRINDDGLTKIVEKQTKIDT